MPPYSNGRAHKNKASSDEDTSSTDCRQTSLKTPATNIVPKSRKIGQCNTQDHIENVDKPPNVKYSDKLLEQICRRIDAACIDKTSRVVFPVLFALFNLVYWVTYSRTFR